MSSLCALSCLPSVKKQKHDFNFSRSMYNKTIIRFGFCDIQNNQGLGKGYQPQHPIIVYSLCNPRYTWTTFFSMDISLLFFFFPK